MDGTTDDMHTEAVACSVCHRAEFCMSMVAEEVVAPMPKRLRIFESPASTAEGEKSIEDCDCGSSDCSASSCCSEEAFSEVISDIWDETEGVTGELGDSCRLSRRPSQPDLLVEPAEISGQFARWHNELAEVAPRPWATEKLALAELLLANVQEYGWDTGEHLLQALLSVEEEHDVNASFAARARRMFARARLPSMGPSASSLASEFCIACRESTGNLLLVSELCGHRLHMSCLADGLRLQLREGASRPSSLRCPACAPQQAAPVPWDVARAALGDELSFESTVLDSQDCFEAGRGTLFQLCPEGRCCTKPCGGNYSMQVACHCASKHRFCLYCGQLPHEPMPCSQMLEIRDFITSTCRHVSSINSEPHNPQGSPADRAALAHDIELANFPNLLAAGARPSCQTCNTEVSAGSSTALQLEFESFLGQCPQGTLRASAEIMLPLIQAWDLQAESVVQSAPEERNVDATLGQTSQEAAAVAGSQRLLEATTRPCPRCFVAIEKVGGCHHVTCTNARCRHEFCWLCLRDWASPGHDVLECALRRLHGQALGSMHSSGHRIEGMQADNQKSAVLQDVESRIRENYASQPVETRPKKEEDYAEEVRNRIQQALSMQLEGDLDLILSAFQPHERNPLLVSMSLLQLYDQQERRAREAAAVAFDAALSDVALREQCLSEVRCFLDWLRPRWWLRLNAADAEQLPLGDWGAREFVQAVRARAEKALHGLRCRETLALRERELDFVCRRYIEQHAAMPLSGNSFNEVLSLLHKMLNADRASWSEVQFATAPSDPGAGHPDVELQPKGTATGLSSGSASQRAIMLAEAAACSWRAGRLLELMGVLQPPSGRDAYEAAVAAETWLEQMEERATVLRRLISSAVSEGAPEPGEFRCATDLLDEARRSVFRFALEYCGSTRRTVRHRA